MHQDRFYNVFMARNLCSFVVALWALSSTAAAVAPPPADCTVVIPSVISCLDFVSDGSTDPAPTKECCTGIGGVIKGTPQCLCFALKLAPSYGNFNMTRILGLPGACSLKTPDLDCIKNALQPPSPNPAVPSPAPAPSLSPVTPHPVPSPGSASTPVAPPTTPPAPSRLPSVPTSPPSTPPALSPPPSVTTPPPARSVPTPPSAAPATPKADDGSGTSSAKHASRIALAGSIVLVLSGLMQ